MSSEPVTSVTIKRPRQGAFDLWLVVLVAQSLSGGYARSCCQTVGAGHPDPATAAEHGAAIAAELLVRPC